MNINDIKESRDIMSNIIDFRDTKLLSAIMGSHYFGDNLELQYRLQLQSLSDNFYKFQKLTNNIYEDELKVKLQELYDSLTDLTSQISRNESLEKIKIYSNKVENKIDSVNEIFKNKIPQNVNIDDGDIIPIIMKEIKKHLPEFDPDNEIEKHYYNLNFYQQKNIYKELANLRNRLVNNDYSLSELESITEPLNNVLTQLTTFDELKQLSEDVKATVKNFNITNTTSNNLNILEIYEVEAKKYDTKISNLELTIYCLFGLLILILSIKFILHLCGVLKVLDLNGFIIFASLIFAITGFLTFLVKERNRFLNIQNFYTRRHLELKALPNYMSELNLDQRRELTIDLANTYFSGKTEEVEKETYQKNVTELNNLIEEFKKLITNIKEIGK